MRMRTLAVSLALVLTACSSSHVLVGDHDGGSTHDAGHDRDGGDRDGGDRDAGEPRFCGGIGGRTCAADEFCDYPDTHMCGITDGGGVCVPRPAGCDFDYDPHCGCDGVTYSNACAARAAGVDTLHRGECASTPCAPDDARGEGDCDAVVGVVWDGSVCRHISGCTCVGADCGRWTSLEACEAAHAMCPVPL